MSSTRGVYPCGTRNREKTKGRTDKQDPALCHKHIHRCVNISTFIIASTHLCGLNKVLTTIPFQSNYTSNLAFWLTTRVIAFWCHTGKFRKWLWFDIDNLMVTKYIYTYIFWQNSLLVLKFNYGLYAVISIEKPVTWNYRLAINSVNTVSKNRSQKR